MIRTEKGILRWFGHTERMDENRLTSQASIKGDCEWLSQRRRCAEEKSTDGCG